MTRSRSSKASSDAVPPASRTLVAALVRPESLTELTPAAWDMVIRQARRTRLLGRLACQSARLGLTDRFPARAADILAGERCFAEENARATRWEIDRLTRVFDKLDLPLVLLKGGAYEAAQLPPAEGRLAADVDVLVPLSELARAEAGLRDGGWEGARVSAYVQRYYRDWMHEVPPMWHATRGTELDLHHTILPRTGRVQPNADLLWQDTVATSRARVRVLAPEDMVLHSTAHLFQDGNLRYAIRDLVDFTDLVRHFARDAEFWDRLIARATVHALSRPLFYAVRFAGAILALDVPDDAAAALADTAPAAPVLRLMDRLAPRALLPGDPDAANRGQAGAALFLYVRSHWLRMPPAMLAAHLTHQAFTRALDSVTRNFQKREEREA